MVNQRFLRACVCRHWKVYICRQDQKVKNPSYEEIIDKAALFMYTYHLFLKKYEHKDNAERQNHGPHRPSWITAA